MNILGVGGMELVFILLIMLVVAGPKRMLRWAYVLGVYTSKLRRMWEETVDYIQHEFDEAGVDVKVPREVPTRANLNRAVQNAMKPVTQPLDAALKEVRQPLDDSLNEVKQVGKLAGSNGRPAPAVGEPPATKPPVDLGSWSAPDSPDSTPSKP